MQREQIIEALEEQMVRNGSDRKGLKAVLETYETKQLIRFYEKRIVQPTPQKKQEPTAKHQPPEIMGDQGLEDLAWVHLSRVRINGKMPANNTANRKIVFSWLHPGEQPTVKWFLRVLAEQPGLADQIIWETILSPDQRKQAEAAALAQDRTAFAELCRRYSLSECAANFNVWRSTNSISGLAPATPEEQAKFEEERIEAHNAELLRVAETNPDQLRARVRQESEARQQAAQQERAEHQFQAAQQRDASRGFQVLPDTWNGQKLDAGFIKNCSVEVQKFLTQKFGSAQLTARLQGRG